MSIISCQKHQIPATRNVISMGCSPFPNLRFRKQSIESPCCPPIPNLANPLLFGACRATFCVFRVRRGWNWSMRTAMLDSTPACYVNVALERRHQ